MVGDQQGPLIERAFGVIQQGDLLTGTTGTHANFPVETGQIEGVHGLPQFQQHEIGDIHHGVDTAHSAAGQLFHQPGGARP